MIRAGALDRSLTVERSTTTFDPYGVPTETWATIAILRAEIVQTSAEEHVRGSGASTETAITFRTRFMDSLTLADRVLYQGQIHDLKQVTELGRRRGLEIRTVARGG